MVLKEVIKSTICSYFNNEIDSSSVIIENPKERKLGDLALPCFTYAKILHKAPNVIANEIKEYLDIATSLGLSALVEAHTEEEEVKMALNCGAKIIGVNNRNLKDFTVDINNCINLRKLVPENILFVGESGIKTSTDIANLKKANVNAVLIGETLMRSEDKSKALTELNGEPLYK